MAEGVDVPGLPPAEFLRLVGHPLRWRLLGELARSDQHVHELTELLGQPQSLVSYHLGKYEVHGWSRRDAARRTGETPTTALI